MTHFVNPKEIGGDRSKFFNRINKVTRNLAGGGRDPILNGAGVARVRWRQARQNENGALGGIRTPDPQIRSLVLYPAELRALKS
jgi:hypothetical protein